MAGLEIRPARGCELDAVWALARRAVRWMNEQGNPQWGEDYPTRALYAGDIARGDLWCAVDGERVAGVACITAERPGEYPPGIWQAAGPALVIHRMAVDPRFQGRGAARALFAQAEALARGRGMAALHVDTYTENTRMLGLLAALGFVRRGALRQHGRPLPYPCFEKLISLPPEGDMDCNSPAGGI